MPKGKVHGKGGSKGKQTREAQQRAARAEKAKAKITGKQLARMGRKLRRTIAEVEKLTEFAEGEMRKIQEALQYRRINHVTASLRYLALADWYAEQMKGIKIIEDGKIQRSPTPKELDFFADYRAETLRGLRKGLTDAQIRERVEKWKSRIGRPGY